MSTGGGVLWKQSSKRAGLWPCGGVGGTQASQGDHRESWVGDVGDVTKLHNFCAIWHPCQCRSDYWN